MLCLVTADQSDDCAEGDITDVAGRALARFVAKKMVNTTFKTVLKVYFPEGVNDKSRGQIATLQSVITTLAVEQIRYDTARLEPLPRANAERYITDVDNHARRERQDSSNYTVVPSTNTVTYTPSPGLQHAWGCAGAGNKAGCGNESFDGRRGSSLFTK